MASCVDQSRFAQQRSETASATPWEQAFSLLADIATFPRKALTDSFFFRGLKVSETDLIEAMNVADDTLIEDLRARRIKDRCKAELDLLDRIQRVRCEARERCELVSEILGGAPVEAIDEALEKMESA